MNKVKVLFLSIFYPLFMGRYFLNALNRNPNVDVKTTGVFTGAWQAWKGGMYLDPKWVCTPDYPLPFKPNVGRVSYDLVRSQLPDDWHPDIVMTVDAGLNWIDKPLEGVIVTVGTDSHCLDYSHARQISDKFFNMHWTYHQDGDIDLPYAFDASVMYPMSDIEKDFDAVLIGMPYPQRIAWVERLREKGVSVLFENGPILDEYRELNNRAMIGMNWASMQDLNCRVFELMAMRLCPVINRVPDLGRLGFEEGRHYLGFDEVLEATEKVLWAKEHPDEAQMIADNAHQKVNQDGHTFDNRVKTVLEECGYA